MNSRERVIAALGHKEPDRVPIDLGGMGSTTIHAIAYNRLKAHLGLDLGPTRVYDAWQQVAKIDDEIRRLFDVDVVALDRVRISFGLSNEAWQPYTLPDGSPAVISADFDPLVGDDGSLYLRDSRGEPYAMLPKDGYWFDIFRFPLQDATTVQDIVRYDWESMLWPEEDFEILRQRAKKLYEETDYAILGSFGGHTLENGQLLRGHANFMFDMAGDKRMAEALLDAVCEVHLENARRYLAAVAPYATLVQVTDDLGGQDAPWMSLEMYRELIKSRHARLYSLIREHADFLFIHSDGAIRPFLNDLNELGVNVLNPVQTTARDMDPVSLKREFGDRMAFWGGGVETQQFLLNATPEQIDEHVRERMSILAPGGGFVFAPEQNFMPEISPEQIVAVYEAAKRYRNYH